jgi:hypothetical protein
MLIQIQEFVHPAPLDAVHVLVLLLVHHVSQAQFYLTIHVWFKLLTAQQAKQFITEIVFQHAQLVLSITMDIVQDFALPIYIGLIEDVTVHVLPI